MLQLFVIIQIYPIQIYREGPEIKSSAPGTDNAPFGLFCHLWDGTCQGLFMRQIWSFYSSFTNFKCTEGVLKFNNSASETWPRPLCRYFVTHEMELSKIYLGTNLKFLSSPVPKIRRRCNAMAGWARGCAQTNVWISVAFYLTPPYLASE